MATRAAISPGYRWRLGIIGLVCLGFAAYCFYDGYYAYPLQRKTFVEFQKIQEENPLDYQEKWTEHAKERGYSLEKPVERTQMDIWTQYIMMAIVLPFGVIFTVSFLRSGGRWIEMNERGITTSSGQDVPFESITQLNKERWYTKGIATVRYRSDEGIERTLILDDWKFQREPITEMVDKVHSLLKPEQVVGHREKPAETESSEPPQEPGAGA